MRPILFLLLKIPFARRKKKTSSFDDNRFSSHKTFSLLHPPHTNDGKFPKIVFFFFFYFQRICKWFAFMRIAFLLLFINIIVFFSFLLLTCLLFDDVIVSLTLCVCAHQVWTCMCLSIAIRYVFDLVFTYQLFFLWNDMKLIPNRFRFI